MNTLLAHELSDALATVTLQIGKRSCISQAIQPPAVF